MFVGYEKKKESLTIAYHRNPIVFYPLVFGVFK